MTVFCVQFQCQSWIFGFSMRKRFALFVKKKRDVLWGFYKLAKKLFFEFQKVWNHTFFFFFQLWGFFRKTEEKKTQFSFSNCKNSQFCASKKKFFSNFTLVHRHLPNSRETVSSFTAVSLKLTWNSKNGQSFSETGCQKYVVFGMKSAKSTVSLKRWRKKKWRVSS